MKLWHPFIIPGLPRQLLLTLHRHCCALRGRSWGRKGRDVEFLWNYPLSLLEDYHRKVMGEMRARGYKPAAKWATPGYRGTNAAPIPEKWVAECWSRTRSAVQFEEHSLDCGWKHMAALSLWVANHRAKVAPDDELRAAAVIGDWQMASLA